MNGPTKVPVCAQLCPAAEHFAFASGLPAFCLMHPLTYAPQSAANTEQFEVIKNATDSAVSRKTVKRLRCEMLISNTPDRRNG